MIYFDGKIGTSRIAIWKVQETEIYLSSQLSDAHDLEIVASFANEKRRFEWLSVRVLLKSMLGEEKCICYDDEGKPSLKDGSYYISISHTRDYICVGLNRDCPIGIDAEVYTDRLQKMRSRIIGSKEIIDEDDSIRHLTLHWCAKEAMYKLTNTKKLSFKDDLTVLPFAIGADGTFCIEQDDKHTSFRAEANYKLFDEFALVCAQLK